MMNAANPNAELPMPEFGSRAEGKPYVPRPGAYAILLDSEGKIAVLDTPRGGFLPGGGIDDGETPEEALHREVTEECGLSVTIGRRLGEAIEWVYTPGNAAGLRKDCVFFAATVDSAGGAATEQGHVLVWLTPDEAEARLKHQSEVWAVRQSGAPTLRPRACGALLRNRSILMVRHAAPARTFWTLPGGGVDVGETPAEAAEREMWEETGLRATAVRLLFQSTYGDAHSPEYYFLMIAADAQVSLGFDPEDAHLAPGLRQLQGVEWRRLDEMHRDGQVAAVLAALTNEEKEALL